MPQDRGWIKLHRCIYQHPRSNNPEWLAVWVWLLTHASHKPTGAIFKGRRITLMPGQMVTGRNSISLQTGVKPSTVYRILKQLIGEQQIEQQSSSTSSLISVVNWDYYQSGEQQSEQRANNEIALKVQKGEQQMDNKSDLLTRTCDASGSLIEQQENSERTANEHIQEVKNVRNSNSIGENEYPELLQRILCIFRKKKGTKTQRKLDKGEATAWKGIKNHVTDEEVTLIERFYAETKSKQYDQTWNRKGTPAQLMNQWHQQVDLAGSYYEKHSPVQISKSEGCGDEW